MSKVFLWWSIGTCRTHYISPWGLSFSRLISTRLLMLPAKGISIWIWMNTEICKLKWMRFHKVTGILLAPIKTTLMSGLFLDGGGYNPRLRTQVVFFSIHFLIWCGYRSMSEFY